MYKASFITFMTDLPKVKKELMNDFANFHANCVFISKILHCCIASVRSVSPRRAYKNK